MRTNKTYSVERKVFGRAVTYNTELLAKSLADWTTIDSFSGEVAETLVEASGLAYRSVAANKTRVLLLAGIADTYQFYENLLDSDLDFESKLNVTKHPETLRRLANIALVPSNTASRFIGNEYGGSLYVLSDDKTHMTLPGSDPGRPGESGCPFAGNNPEKSVDPLFNRFAIWAGELVVRHNDLVQADR